MTELRLMERSWPQTDRRLLNIDLVRMKMHLKSTWNTVDSQRFDKRFSSDFHLRGRDSPFCRHIFCSRLQHLKNDGPQVSESFGKWRRDILCCHYKMKTGYLVTQPTTTQWQHFIIRLLDRERPRLQNGHRILEACNCIQTRFPRAIAKKKQT